jgi:hypothetical protein
METIMNGNDLSSSCGRADDLLSVLYGEASEHEQRDFDVHLKQCAGCRAEFAAFAQVRTSIGEWRDEALSGFVASPAPVRKSAIAALRQFFNLSPLWMKAAAGFAVLAFCVLMVFAVSRLQITTGEVPQVAIGNPAAVYTEEDMQRIVQAEVAKEQAKHIVPPKPLIRVSSEPKDATVASSTRIPHSRRPFSRAEREQLAAELRLLSASDENDLELLDKD